MDFLKTILRQAISAKAMRLKLQEGASPEVFTRSGVSRIDGDEHKPDAENLKELFEFLFPNDRALIVAGQFAKGALNVPGVGKIHLIAQPSPPLSLRFYLPPEGNALFESDWQRLANATVTADQAYGSPPGFGSVPPEQGVGAPLPFTPSTGQDYDEVDMSGDVDVGGFIPQIQSPKGRAPAPLARKTPQQPLYRTPSEDSSGFILPPPGAAQDLSGAVGEDGELPGLAAGLAPITPFGETPGWGPQRSGRAERIFFEAEAGDGIVSVGTNSIDALLADVVRDGASDLHLTVGEPVCVRIDGEIRRLDTPPLDSRATKDYLLPIMPKRNQVEFVELNDTDFAYEVQGVGRFRVNVFRDRNGVGAVMRHIPSEILTAEQLELPPAITKFCQLSAGLVLVTGPTGSGKSTTLAAMVDMINKSRREHILTIEDPIEFVHPQHKCLVNQREVHRHTSSFSRALRAALREDPDIVLIGEMRDLETMAIALETAETGHLVFGTLHTITAVSTVDRIIDQFPSDQQEQIRMMLAGSLRGVVTQTLLKKKGGGRVAAHEILVTNDAVSAMIREGKNHMIQNHMQSQKGDGNILLNESLLKYVKDHAVAPEEAYRKAVDKSSFLEMLRRAHIRIDLAEPNPRGAAGRRSA